MDTDRMKVINPKTRLPEYLVGEDNLVEDLNPSRIEADRIRKEKGTNEPNETD
jgi:hypothetical protein